MAICKQGRLDRSVDLVQESIRRSAVADFLLSSDAAAARARARHHIMSQEKKFHNSKFHINSAIAFLELFSAEMCGGPSDPSPHLIQ